MDNSNPGMLLLQVTVADPDLAKWRGRGVVLLALLAFLFSPFFTQNKGGAQALDLSQVQCK